MKRTERHHLKENELAHFAAVARQAVEARRGQLVAVVVVLLAVAGMLVGYGIWQTRLENRAGRLLAEAMAVEEIRVGPPASPDKASGSPSFATDREKHEVALAKYKAVADQYGSTDSGLFARSREASLLMALGRPTEAAAAYQQVLDRSGSVYGQMARLGLAEVQVSTGQYDLAIATYKSLADQAGGTLPVDGVLIQLGRAYLAAGRTTDAQQTFERIVKEFPLSPFSSEAQRQLDASGQPGKSQA